MWRPTVRERSLASVPKPVLVLLVVGLVLQLAWHAWRPGPSINASALPAAPRLEAMRVSALGDPWVASKLVVIWLQAFDNQPGISIGFKDLDYDRVEAWLTRALELDPRARYPLLAASRLYGAVPVEPKQRQMLEFVYQQFLLDPNQRWQWLAHAVITAKHRLKDFDLALRYARAITEHATGPEVPNWAKHMSVVVLRDMGELDTAALLIYSLLEGGLVNDPHETWFLTRQLEELEAMQAGE